MAGCRQPFASGSCHKTMDRPASSKGAQARWLIIEILCCRRRRSRCLSAPRSDHGVGHGGRPRRPSRRWWAGYGSRWPIDELWKTAIPERKLCRVGNGRGFIGETAEQVMLPNAKEIIRRIYLGPIGNRLRAAFADDLCTHFWFERARQPLECKYCHRRSNMWIRRKMGL